MQNYDIIFLTNIPAFYKCDLYARIAKHARILVIFLAKTSEHRTEDFYKYSTAFATLILSEETVEQRSIVSNSRRLCWQLQKIKTKLLVLGGWDAPEYWVALFMARAEKRAIVLESSCFESKAIGIKGYLKSLFIKKVELAFPSGEAHQRLLESIGFRGRIQKTKGVGIFHYAKKVIKETVFRGNFLYVGRLSEEKNVGMLLAVFKAYPQLKLTIVGDGPLRQSLELQAPRNTRFLGHIPNMQMSQIYDQADVLILPSWREPWGLVVEEALHHGLPVIVSRYVGCAKEWVIEPDTGVLFDPAEPRELAEAIEHMCDTAIWSGYRERAQQVNFSLRDQHQVRCYWEAILDEASIHS